MAGDIDPSVVYVILVIISIIHLLPIALIIVILFGVKTIIFRESAARAAVREAVKRLGFATVASFMLFYYLLLRLDIQIVRPIYMIILDMGKNRPSLSIPRRLERPFDVQHSYRGAKCIYSSNKPYEYCSVNGEYDIRLLIIYPGLFNDPLCGEIVTANLLWRPSYDAVSYKWADEKRDMNLSKTIQFVNNSSTILITKNCELAIRRLRLSDKKRRIWIDAVCINQKNVDERNRQVPLMSRIYVQACHVIVYTGEGTAHTDLLFDWVNALDKEGLNIGSIGKFQDIDEAGLGILGGAARIWNGLGATKVWINDISVKLEQFWRAAQVLCFSLIRKSEPTRNIVLSESQLTELVGDYFSRRWFKRVWVLQEVVLPDPNKTRIICGTKITTGERALHLFSLLQHGEPRSIIRVFVLVRQRIEAPKTSHLLDILIETRGRECGDPRDKIFGVLSIVQGMDKGRFPELKPNYEQKPPKVYVYFSIFFIRQHGAGFFLSLIKSRSQIDGLPSWAADWTVPWPNYKAVRGRDIAAGSRATKVEDIEGTRAEFDQEGGFSIMKLNRSRILQGYFTRDGHIDDSTGTYIEDVQHLSGGEVLIEIYPGLAALLMKEDDEYYNFTLVCPHASTKSGVKKLVKIWSRVVVDGEGLQDKVSHGVEAIGYLSPPETFKIR